jgi:hypothetical protein
MASKLILTVEDAREPEAGAGYAAGAWVIPYSSVDNGLDSGVAGATIAALA